MGSGFWDKCCSLTWCLAFAILSGATGFFHLVSCGYFFNTLIGLWNALLLIIFGIYFASVDWLQPGTATLLILTVICSGFAVVGIGVLSVFLHFFAPQSPDLINDEWTIQWAAKELDSRITGRAYNVTELCERKLDHIRSKLGPLDFGDPVLLLSIYSILILIGLLQIVLAFFMCRKIRRICQCEPEIPHFHIIFGFSSLIFGFVHLIYCCRYYYMGAGIWSAAFFMAAGFYHTRTNFPDKAVLLLLNVLTLACSVALVCLSTLGFLCWADNSFFSLDALEFNRTSIALCISEKERFSIARLANGDLYEYCFSGLELLGYWTDRAPNYGVAQAWPELKLTQLIGSGCLALIGILELFLSVFLLIRIWIRDE